MLNNESKLIIFNAELCGSETDREIAIAVRGIVDKAGRYWTWTEKQLNTLAVIAKEAIKLAYERKKQAQLPPDKFLVPFTEAASLEEEADLQAMWAELLLKGITEYGAYLNQFTDILKRIGGAEVKALKAVSDKLGNLDVGSHTIPLRIEEMQVPGIYGNINDRQISLPHEAWSRTYNMWASTPHLDHYLTGGAAVVGSGREYFRDDFYQENWRAFDFLEREGLIRTSVFSDAHQWHLRFNQPIFGGAIGSIGTMDMELTIVRLTQVGISFLKACLPPTQSTNDSGNRGH